MQKKLISIGKATLRGVVSIKDYAGGIARHIVTTLGGALVTDGLVSNEELTTAAGAVVVLVGVALSALDKYLKRQP